METEREKITDPDCSPIICEGCEHEKDCDERGEKEPHILEAQFLLCTDLGRPQYEDDDSWILKMCCEGKGSVTLEEFKNEEAAFNDGE